MATTDYDRIAQAIAYLEAHVAERPSLPNVARVTGLSPFHFQRLFRRWAGVSPKRLLQYMTAQRAKAALRNGRTVLDAAYDTGLSGPGRLHDLLVSVEAVTPGEVRAAGAGVTIRWGQHETPFGRCLVAVTDRGVCQLAFDQERLGDLLGRLEREWPAARLQRDQAGTAPFVRRIFAPRHRARPLPLHVRGTNFQLKVWEALLRIPPGTTTSYGDLADRIGAPGAARAVGSAVGANPVAYVIPCHRVLRASGALGGYRWGTDRKRVMLAREAVRRVDSATG